MTAQKAERRLDQLERALARPDEALAVPADAPLAIDGAVQRFEFVFELYWKAMKALLELASPSAELGTARSVIRAAYAAGWIDDEAGWLDLLDMRNATSHTYRESAAREVYRRIAIRAPMLQSAYPKLRQKLP